jgi:hydrogenase maturation protease
MNAALVDRIVNAVLYEGYILYPYRPSLKNRQRWTFGGLYPDAWCRSQGGGDAASSQTECLVSGGVATRLRVAVRFLHLTARTAGECVPPLPDWPEGVEPPFRPVEVLRVGDRRLPTWQEAEERTIAVEEGTLGELTGQATRRFFAFPGRRQWEPVRGAGGEVVGVLVREQQRVAGRIELTAQEADTGLFRLKVRVENRTPRDDAGRRSRDDALLCSLISTHVILEVRGGEFVSLLDPPECWREAAAACRNVGTWPVLVGAEGQKDLMLSSPIILYDYPQVAPESPGDFFDGTEIDEMLTLRVLTLTDEEKRAMAGVDERAGALLARTEALAREQLLGLHGTLRGLRPLPGEDGHGELEP